MANNVEKLIDVENKIDAIYSLLLDGLSDCAKLSSIVIDTDKDWQGYNITNFGSNGYDINATLASLIAGQFSGDLSDLTIDTNKDWQGYNITNLGDIYPDSIYVDNVYEKTNNNEIVFHNDMLANANATIEIGDTTNYFKTLYLSNDGGDVLQCQGVQSGGGQTDYTFNCGGGQWGGDLNQGGIFTFKMNDITTGLGTCVNQIVFDPGRPDVFAAGTTNDVIFQSFNGIATYGFVSTFGGWNDVEYGFELRRISGTEASAKTLILDNQIPVSDSRRSIDLRINSVNKLTIENDGTVVVTDLLTSPEIDVAKLTSPFNIGAGHSVTSLANFFGLGWFDFLTFNSLTANLGCTVAAFPNGTATDGAVNVYNSSNSGAVAWLSQSVRGSIAELVVRDFAQTTNITDLNIGSGGNDFPILDVTCSTLASINFIYAGVTECQIQPDTLVFNNGATDTQIDWATNGELGLQVATNDIIRLTATQIQAIQNIIMADNIKTLFGTGQDVDQYYDGTYFYTHTDLQNPSDWRIDCGTDKTIELQDTVWDDLRIIPGAFEFAGVSDPSLQNWQPGGAGATYKIWKFSSGDEVFFTCQIPHSYNEGSDIEAHVHWTPADRGDEESGNTVAWKLDYSWANNSTVFPSSSTADMTDTCTGTDDYHEMTSSATITGTSKGISSMLACRLYRDAGDTWAGITAAQSPGLLEFDIHYQINTIGSRQEFVK